MTVHHGKSATLTIIILVAVLILLGPGVFFIGGLRANRMIVRVLSKTDHQALLMAGREILSQMPKMQNRTPEGYHIDSHVDIPKEIHLPQALRDLSARTIWVHVDGYMGIEMHGGMAHFGFNIYPEDFNAPDSYFIYGDRKIIDGLWYNDEQYINNPEYDKRVDALLAKNKYRK